MTPAVRGGRWYTIRAQSFHRYHKHKGFVETMFWELCVKAITITVITLIFLRVKMFVVLGQYIQNTNVPQNLAKNHENGNSQNLCVITRV